MEDGKANKTSSQDSGGCSQTWTNNYNVLLLLHSERGVLGYGGAQRKEKVRKENLCANIVLTLGKQRGIKYGFYRSL